MLRKTLPAVLFTVSAIMPICTKAAEKFVLKSVSVDLPFGDRKFPQGPGSDTTAGNCLACHSAGMVLNEAAMSKAQWRAEVDKMRAAYKAPIDPKDTDTIVNYLFAINGTK